MCTFCQNFKPDREYKGNPYNQHRMGHCKATKREVKQLPEFGLKKAPPECSHYTRAKRRPRQK